MSELLNKTCTPCRGGVPPMDEKNATVFLARLGAGWEISPNGHLDKTFAFPEFMDGIRWVTQLAALAEREGHHPNIYIDYNKVRVEIWTHKINGLSENDFILAAKADALPAVDGGHA